MDVGYFVIAILGCADGSANCTPLATEPTHYASQASCSAATQTALLRNTDLDSPNLVAECRKVQAPASADRRPTRPAPSISRKG
jgi:hypothetical protein